VLRVAMAWLPAAADPYRWDEQQGVAFTPGIQPVAAASAQRLDQTLTGPLAAPARLGTDPAVLVHLGVALALIRAGPAGLRAGFEDRPGQVGGATSAYPYGGAGNTTARTNIGIGRDDRRPPGAPPGWAPSPWTTVSLPGANADGTRFA
jgi:hypothetical protein